MAGGDRDPGRVQQHFGKILVLGNRFRDRAGVVGFGRLDAPLPAAPAELHHAAFRQATVGDATHHGSGDDRPRARSQAHIFVKLAESGERQPDIKGFVVHRCLAKGRGEIKREAPDGFFGVLDHHLKHAKFRRRDCFPEGDRAPGGGLQAQRGCLQRMGH